MSGKNTAKAEKRANLNTKAVLFECGALALALVIGAWLGKIAPQLSPLWAFCAFFWFSYSLNYLTMKLFKNAEHWFMELLASPPVLFMVVAFCLNIPPYMDRPHMLMLALAVFLALTFHTYEAIITINNRLCRR